MKIEIEIPDRVAAAIRYAAMIAAGPDGEKDPNSVRNFAADALALQTYFAFDQTVKMEHLEQILGLDGDEMCKCQDRLRDILVRAQGKRRAADRTHSVNRATR